jgi:membrane protein implicated in regulation of membrane protease activity
VRALTSKLDPSLVSYAVAIGLGLLRPNAAVVLYLVIALFVIIPFRTVFRRIRPGRTRNRAGRDRGRPARGGGRRFVLPPRCVPEGRGPAR